jgi:hypothetical protein
MHFLVVAGMPRRIPNYPDSFYVFNKLSSIGFYMSVISVLLFFYILSESFIINSDKEFVTTDAKTDNTSVNLGYHALDIFQGGAWGILILLLTEYFGRKLKNLFLVCAFLAALIKSFLLFWVIFYAITNKHFFSIALVHIKPKLVVKNYPSTYTCQIDLGHYCLDQITTKLCCVIFIIFFFLTIYLYFRSETTQKYFLTVITYQVLFLLFSIIFIAGDTLLVQLLLGGGGIELCFYLSVRFLDRHVVHDYSSVWKVDFAISIIRKIWVGLYVLVVGVTYKSPTYYAARAVILLSTEPTTFVVKALEIGNLTFFFNVSIQYL